MKLTYPQVSVIMPVYNGQTFIERAVVSVLEQDYADLELIIVDDGSTDGTAQIIDRLAETDGRIRVIHQPNGGAMQARRTGLNLARGKYIQHLDSDDELLPGAIGVLVAKAEATNADMVIAPFYFCHEDGRRELSMLAPFDQAGGRAYLREVMCGNAYWCVWAKFAKRSLYDGVQLMDDVGMMEDFLTMSQILVRDPLLVSVDQPIINYYLLSVSLSHGNKNLSKRLRQFCAAHQWLEGHIVQLGLADYYREALLKLKVEQFYVSVIWGDIWQVDKALRLLGPFVDQHPEYTAHFHPRSLRYARLYSNCRWWGRLKLLFVALRRKHLV